MQLRDSHVEDTHKARYGGQGASPLWAHYPLRTFM